MAKMFNEKEFKTAIEEREKTSDKWDYGIEQCNKKAIAILTRNLDETIEYLIKNVLPLNLFGSVRF